MGKASREKDQACLEGVAGKMGDGGGARLKTTEGVERRKAGGWMREDG